MRSSHPKAGAPALLIEGDHAYLFYCRSGQAEPFERNSASREEMIACLAIVTCTYSIWSHFGVDHHPANTNSLTRLHGYPAICVFREKFARSANAQISMQQQYEMQLIHDIPWLPAILGTFEWEGEGGGGAFSPAISANDQCQTVMLRKFFIVE